MEGFHPVARRLAPPLLGAFAAFTLGAITALPAQAGVGSPGACIATTLRGTDVGRTSGLQLIRFSHGLAQTFVAPDTLVSAISVWLPISRRNLAIPLRLFILNTDADGRPLPDAPVADGGELDTGNVDGTRSARFTYVFDPPAMLPASGRYAVALVPSTCTVMPVLVNPGGDYPEGGLWDLVGRQCNGRSMSVGSHLSDNALTFRVEFCEGGTATTGRTWGELKTLYR